MGIFVKKYWKYAVFTFAGALIGFAYWRFIGCRTGSCPLTANWHTSVLFGGLIGLLAVPSKNKRNASKTKQHNGNTNED